MGQPASAKPSRPIASALLHILLPIELAALPKLAAAVNAERLTLPGAAGYGDGAHRIHTMSARNTVALGGRLTIGDLDAVAQRRAAARAGSAGARRDRALPSRSCASSRRPIPPSTGSPPAAVRWPATASTPAQREAFQRNLVRSHAVTLGAAHPTAFVRAAMAARAHVLALGCSGVEPACVELLIGMLNAGMHPIVREVGGVGASGDLVELAQIALAVLGEGEVELRRTARFAAAEALQPSRPHAAGAALPRGPGADERHVVSHRRRGAGRARCAPRRRRRAGRRGACCFEALGGHREALDPALHAARPHAGQRAVAERLAALTRDSRLVRADAPRPGGRTRTPCAASRRCSVPALDAIEAAAAVVEIELNAVSDNPLFLADEGRVVHGGNFHGQPVAHGARSAQDRPGRARRDGRAAHRPRARRGAERRPAAVPHPRRRRPAQRLHGPAVLRHDAGRRERGNSPRRPACARSRPTPTIRTSSAWACSPRATPPACSTTCSASIAIELLCAAQALDLRGVGSAGAGTRAAHAIVSAHVAPLLEDRPVGEDVDAARGGGGAGGIC